MQSIWQQFILSVIAGIVVSVLTPKLSRWAENQPVHWNLALFLLVFGLAFLLIHNYELQEGGPSQLPARSADTSSAYQGQHGTPAQGVSNVATPKSEDGFGRATSGEQLPDTGTSQQASSSTRSTSISDSKSVMSSNGFAIVFDPPSNVRVAPSATSGIICSVTAKIPIRILGTEGNWYKTDICGGKSGYIHRSQIKF